MKQRVRVPDEVSARGDAEPESGRQMRNGVVKGWWYWTLEASGVRELGGQYAGCPTYSYTHNESELSRYAELDAVARTNGGSGRSVLCASVSRCCNANVSRRARSVARSVGPTTCETTSITEAGQVTRIQIIINLNFT